MNLGQLRAEVMAHGFDSTQFGATRVNLYLNSAQDDIARQIGAYYDEGSLAVATVAGTATFSQPADLARSRDLIDTDLQRTLQSVSLKYVDTSALTTGTPTRYAIDGLNYHLFPTPDGVHNLLLRYWRVPPDLVNDSDSPSLPQDLHDLLWQFAVAYSYMAEDDFTLGQQWMTLYTQGVRAAKAQLTFVNGDAPTQAQSMWDTGLGRRGWQLSGSDWG